MHPLLVVEDPGPAEDPGVPQLTFARGLPGFPSFCRATLVRWGDEASPWSLLVDLDVATTRFLVVPPAVFFPDLVVELDDVVCARLDLHHAEECLLLVLVTVPGNDLRAATANLLGPLVVNTRTGQAEQAVLAESGLPTRAPLLG